MNIPVIATGLSGLVGTRVQELLRGKYDFTDLSFATGVDITDIDAVEENIKDHPAKIILHMAAKTDVDGCEDDKILGEEGAAWHINVLGTQNIVDIAGKYSKKVVYISTDFVFDGSKDSYAEEDEPNPINWYGVTKHEAEIAIIKSDIEYSILRIAYPYRAQYSEKMDFVRRIISLLDEKKEIKALSDHIITPTFIDDIAAALDTFLAKDLTGIFHLVGSGSLSVYEAALKISSFSGKSGTIKPVWRKDYFLDRAYRPFNLTLKNDKIKKLGMVMESFDNGLAKMLKQI